MAYPVFADVAELADAQVSEACDGDIVEVQVLSSAPSFRLLKERVGSQIPKLRFQARFFLCLFLELPSHSCV